MIAWPLLTLCQQHSDPSCDKKQNILRYCQISRGTKITMGQELLQTEPSYLAFSPKLPTNTIRENLLYTINSFVLEVFSGFKMNTF